MAGPGRKAAALFGGTFDPFHNGHLRMAVELAETLALSRVVLLVARHPPHKPGRPLSKADHRLAMAAAAVAGIPGLEVSDAELRREGPSYSLDTVTAFRDAETDVDWIFALGADSFAEVSTWHRWRELLSSCDFALLPRPGAPRFPGSPAGLRLEKEEPHCYSWVGETYRLPAGRRLFCPSLPVLDISSSSIREKVRGGMCIRGLVPGEVESYIVEHGLYAGPGEDERP